MKKRAKMIGVIITVIFVILLIAFGILRVVKICNKNYNDALNNPPSKILVEEQLEFVFLTTQVEVLEIDDDGDVVIYTVKANGYKYKVLYQLCSTNYVGYYAWRYIRHAQIQG